MATSKNRVVNLARRPATLSNLNLSPEKSGDDLVDRVDLSLKFNVKDNDIDQLIASARPLKDVFWDGEGDLIMDNIGPIISGIETEGTVEIGTSVSNMLTFEGAKLKKLKVQVFIEHQAEAKCQIRIDPTGHHEELAEMRLAQDVVITYQGKGKDDSQGELTV